MDRPRNNKTAIWSRPALWLLILGTAGTLIFAALLTLKMLERKRDTEYYNAMSASFFVPTSADVTSDDTKDTTPPVGHPSADEKTPPRSFAKPSVPPAGVHPSAEGN